MHLRIVPLVLVVAGASVAQQVPPPQRVPTILVASSSQDLDAPRFSAMGPPQCSDKGEIFFHVPLSSNSFSDNSVMEISPKSSDPVMFRLANDLKSTNAFVLFSVTPSGGVWFLDWYVEDPAKEGAPYVFGFDTEGEMTSREKLDVPEHLSADDFAVSLSGVIFLAAHFNANAPQSLRGKRFQALFERSGRLRTEIKSADSDDVDLKQVQSGNGGRIALGTDGNFYFLRPDKIIVISQSAEIIRSIPFQKPGPDMSAATLRLSAGLASIEFHKVEESGRIHSEFLVLDADTGDTYGLYLPPDAVGASLCFSRNAGFTFLAKEGKKNKLVIAAMR